MTLGESLGVFRYCNDAQHRGCNRIGVRETGEDTEGVYRYQYRGHPMATPNVPQLLFLMVI